MRVTVILHHAVPLDGHDTVDPTLNVNQIGGSHDHALVSRTMNMVWKQIDSTADDMAMQPVETYMKEQYTFLRMQAVGLELSDLLRRTDRDNSHQSTCLLDAPGSDHNTNSFRSLISPSCMVSMMLNKKWPRTYKLA